MITEIEEVDVVAPLATIPATSDSPVIKAGTQGTVLVKSATGALLVEFSDCVGVTLAEVWLEPSDVRVVWSAKTGQFAAEKAERILTAV